MPYFRREKCLFGHEASGTMSERFLSCSTSCTDADVTVSSERRVERILTRAGGGAERLDDVHGQAAGRVAGDRGGHR